MNKFTFLRILPFFCAMLLLTHSGWGQETIHYWSFNDEENSELDAGNDEPTSIPADIGDGVINHELSFGSFGGSTINAEPGFDAGQDWSVSGSGNIGETFKLVFSTEGFENITLSFAIRRSDTGYNNNLIEVSSDGGNTWTEVQSGFNPPTSYALRSFSLTSVDADVDNNSDFDVIVRYTFDVDGVTGAGNNRFDNIKITGVAVLPPDVVATPTFNPGSGTYYAPFEVAISTTTDEATILYSFDSDDPTTGTWETYDDEDRPEISQSSTIWAYATKVEMDDSQVASAEYTLPIEVASIEALQAIAEEDGLYRITGEVFMTYKNAFRNQKYFQDNLSGGRGIKIDDEPGYLKTYLEIGDGVIDLVGTINVFNRMIRLRPIEDQSPEEAHSTGNTLTPLPVTLADIIDEDNIITVAGQEISIYQGLLIEVEDLQFEQTGNFDSGTSFGELPISDPTASLEDIDEADFGVIFRVEYADLGYNGDPIPQAPLTLTAIVDQRFANARIFARDWDDFDIPDPLLFASPLSITGLDYVVDEGPSDAQSFELTGINLDGTDVTITAPDNFEVSQNETTGFGAGITLTAYDGSSETIWLRLEAGLPVGEYSGNVVISGGDADEVQVALSGEVTEPLVTEVPFETKFGIDENWGGTGTGYQERWYEEGGWFFHSSSAVRGGSGEAFGGSDYSFRDAGGFTIKNLAEIDGMTGFSLQLRNWMGTATNPANTERNLNISFDGGVTWATLVTLSQEWFDAFQVYQEFVHYFSEEQNLDAEKLRITIVDGIDGSAAHRINIGQFKALDDDPPPPNPVFEPVAGIYFEDQFVFVDNYPDYDPGVNVYYTTDGSVPGTGSSLYDDNTGILLTAGDGTITLRAIAIEGDRQSGVTTAVYVFPVDVATIAELRGQPGGDEIYRLTGEAVLTFQHPFRNQKFIQDATAAIKIDDSGGVIEQVYEVGDGIVNITGTLRSFFNMLQFVPVVDPPEANSKGNVIEPLVITLDEIESDHQAQLVQVARVSFDASGDFAPVISYAIFDPSGEGIFRTPNSLAALDYFGTPIPETPVNITAVVEQFGSDMQITARDLEDFEEIELILSKFTVGGIDVLSLPGVLVNDPGDRGAFLYIADFEGVTGIVLETATLGVQYIVTVNGVEIPHQDLPTLPIEVGDVIFVTVIPAEKDAEIQYYKVTATDRDPAAIPIPAWAVLFAGLLMGLFIFLRKFR